MRFCVSVRSVTAWRRAVLIESIFSITAPRAESASSFFLAVPLRWPRGAGVSVDAFIVVILSVVVPAGCSAWVAGGGAAPAFSGGEGGGFWAASWAWAA